MPSRRFVQTDQYRCYMCLPHNIDWPMVCKHISNCCKLCAWYIFICSYGHGKIKMNTTESYSKELISRKVVCFHFVLQNVCYPSVLETEPREPMLSRYGLCIRLHVSYSHSLQFASLMHRDIHDYLMACGMTQNDMREIDRHQTTSG